MRDTSTSAILAFGMAGVLLRSRIAQGCVVGFEHRLPIVEKPVRGKLDAAPSPLGSERKVDRATQLVGDEVANCACPKAGLVRGDNGRATDLPPFEHQAGWLPIQPTIPPDRHAS